MKTGRTLLALLPILAAACMEPSRGPAWTEAEIAILESLSIDRLGPPPPDPSNAVADDPRAVDLGRRLFFDAAPSRNGEVSCATCHQPELYFTDGRATALALGAASRSTPSIVGASHSPWLTWDGRKDSLWSQALAPMEHPDEQGGTRSGIAHHVAEVYRGPFEALFGLLPDLRDRARFPRQSGPHGTPTERRRWNAMAAEDRAAITGIYVGVGKAIAAYERTLVPGRSRFDEYVTRLAEARDATVERRSGSASSPLSADEVAGLRLFIGTAGCIQCHNGPLLTNHGFHNVGSAPCALDGGRSAGRIAAVQEVLFDPFNCSGPWSDAAPEACSELRHIKVSGEELFGAVRTPSLRSIARTAPYMSCGQHASLEEVVTHYNRADDLSAAGHSDLEPLGLDERESAQLVAFLRTLDSPVVSATLRGARHLFRYRPSGRHRHGAPAAL